MDAFHFSFPHATLAAKLTAGLAKALLLNVTLRLQSTCA